MSERPLCPALRRGTLPRPIPTSAGNPGGSRPDPRHPPRPLGGTRPVLLAAIATGLPVPRRAVHELNVVARVVQDVARVRQVVVRGGEGVETAGLVARVVVGVRAGAVRKGGGGLLVGGH